MGVVRISFRGLSPFICGAIRPAACCLRTGFLPAFAGRSKPRRRSFSGLLMAIGRFFTAHLVGVLEVF